MGLRFIWRTTLRAPGVPQGPAESGAETKVFSGILRGKRQMGGSLGSSAEKLQMPWPGTLKGRRVAFQVAGVSSFNWSAASERWTSTGVSWILLKTLSGSGKGATETGE